MKIPRWIKALAYLRFTVQHDGTEERFWSYEKALKYKNNVLDVSKSLSFSGFHILRGWLTFYQKISMDQCSFIPSLPKKLAKKLDMWTAEAVK